MSEALSLSPATPNTYQVHFSSNNPAEEAERRERELAEARKQLEELHPQLDRYKAWVAGEALGCDWGGLAWAAVGYTRLR